MKRLLALAALALASCASTPPEPVVRTVELKVPVVASCIPKDLPPAPTYPDTREALRSAPGPEDRFQLLAAGWPVRDVRLRMLEGVAAACRRTGPPDG